MALRALYGLDYFIWISPSNSEKRAPNLLLVFIFGLTYGLLVEILQFILPTNRSPEVADFIADAFGSLAAIGVLRWVFHSPSKDQDPT